MNEQEKLALVLHLASRHGANRERYEETNPGLGLRAPLGEDSYLGVGAYRNSLGRTSVYGGVGKEFLTLGDMLGLRLNAGAITGYGDSVLPFVIPEARVNLPGRSDLLMQYIPEVSHGNLRTDPVLGFSLRIPFGGDGSRRAAAPTFDPDGDGYDYATARAAGIAPDDTGHWPSRVPKTGLLLKGRAHPTFEKTLAKERELGFRVIRGPDGRYYSVK